MTHEQIHTHAIFINNRMVLGGDAVSARIVFKNLTKTRDKPRHFRPGKDSVATERSL